MIMIHAAAHEYAGGRWLALGGGGYAVAQVVPRAWSHLLAVAAHVPLDVSTPIPEAWREHVHQVYGFPAPVVMGDGALRLPRPWEQGYDPADPVDRTILAVRNAIFPDHGLDPLYD